jgi:hypothetical protein
VTARREWVATSTFVSGRDESFYEEGGIYARRVVGDTRLLDPTERVVNMPALRRTVRRHREHAGGEPGSAFQR